MAEAQVRITKSVVDKVMPGDRDVFIWDRELKGFGVRVWPSGRKTFVAKYRVGGGREGTTRRFTIGTYGTLTVDEARAAARQLLAASSQGADPAGERMAKRRELTVAALLDLFAAEGTDHLKERNRRWMLARLQHHIVPILGRKKITDVRIGDVEHMMREIRAGKTAKDEKTGPRARVIVRGGAGAATKAVRDLSAVFTFAVRRELVIAQADSAGLPLLPVSLPWPCSNEM